MEGLPAAWRGSFIATSGFDVRVACEDFAGNGEPAEIALAVVFFEQADARAARTAEIACVLHDGLQKRFPRPHLGACQTNQRAALALEVGWARRTSTVKQETGR
jgi:hypothetical protein